MASLEEIRALIRERMEELRPLRDEYELLERALVVLDGVAPAKDRWRGRDPEAPFGRKADGTPRQRPGRRKPPAPPDKS